MYIDKSLLDEYICPSEGVARIWLRGDREIPEELVEKAKAVDGDSLDVSCFAVDLFDTGAIIVYAAEHGFIDLGYTCTNYTDLFAYFDTWADARDRELATRGWHRHHLRRN